MESTEEKHFSLFIRRHNPKIKYVLKLLPVRVIEIPSIAFSSTQGASASPRKMQTWILNLPRPTLSSSWGWWRSKSTSGLRLGYHRAAHPFLTHPDCKCCRFDHATAKIGEALLPVCTNVSLGAGGEMDSSDMRSFWGHEDICSFCVVFRVFATLFPKAAELYKI